MIACFLFFSEGCFHSDPTPHNNAISSSGFLIKGISLVAPPQLVNENALQPIVDIHSNYIAIMPYSFCTPGDPVIRHNYNGQWWGESDIGATACIEMAHKKNLAVMIKPHLWIKHGEYTGAFTLASEKDWKLWEDSYREYILHYANIADSMKAELLCIGTELGATIKARPQFWNLLIDSIKKTYHGKLTYAANWDDYKSFPFWEKLDYIGVDAYFPLAIEETPSINSIKKGWEIYKDELEKISIEYKRPILFTEYGYRNVDYNCSEPWKENDGNQNDEAQANAMDAFYQSFAGNKWFSGGFVWKWYADSLRHHNRKIDFTPQNKPAAKVIENWYKN